MGELVSIIMPNYNCEKYLKETIESVLNQTYQNWELLFVDDCSTDGSIEIVESFNDSRIRILKNEKNSGAAISRNYGIREAKGRWIAFLDSDDLWEENKLEKHLTFMEKHGHSFSFTGYKVVNSQNVLINEYMPKKDRYDYKAILKHCSIGCSTVIYDTKTLEKVYMPTNAIKREDFACWLSILKTGVNAVCFQELLTIYRIHNDSVSSSKIKMVKYQWNVYRKVEKISFLKSCYYMMHWAIKGFLKYR